MAKSVNIPVCGIGGITTYRDAVEMMMAGASIVQICTAILRKGLRVFREINDGIVQFMKEKGYKNVNDIVGVSIKHIQDPRNVKEEKRVSYIDTELCTLCRECINLCPFDAISLSRSGSTRTAKVDVSKCDGCGLCVIVCPEKAVHMNQKSKIRTN